MACTATLDGCEYRVGGGTDDEKGRSEYATVFVNVNARTVTNATILVKKNLGFMLKEISWSSLTGYILAKKNLAVEIKHGGFRVIQKTELILKNSFIRKVKNLILRNFLKFGVVSNQSIRNY